MSTLTTSLIKGDVPEGTASRPIPLSSPPFSGFIYDYDISLTSVLLDAWAAYNSSSAELLAPRVGMSRRQRASFLSSGSTSVKSLSFRPRPCIALLRDKLLPLTRLCGFHPTFMCAAAQHLLVPVNGTSSWPCDDSPVIDILPVNTWPDRDHAYGIAFPRDRPPHHYGLHGDTRGIVADPTRHSHVSYNTIKAIQALSQKLSDSAASAGLQTKHASRTWNTHSKLHELVLNLDVAHSPADLDLLTKAYNDHVEAVAIVKGAPLPGPRSIPPEHIPLKYRKYLAPQEEPAFPKLIFKYPSRLPENCETLTDDILSFARAVQPTDGHSESNLLIEIFSRVIDVAAFSHSKLLHPAFTSRSPERMSKHIHSDVQLADVLRRLRGGDKLAALVVLDYLFQPATL